MNTDQKQTGARFGAKFTGGWVRAVAGMVALFAPATHAATADLSRLGVVGDSLLAGFRNGGLVDVYQKEGIAAVVAQQAQVALPQPLIGWPGIPAVLDSNGGSSTGRVDLTLQVSNLAVPAQTVNDALYKRPDLPVDSITDLILGLPGLFGGVSKSQVE